MSSNVQTRSFWKPAVLLPFTVVQAGAGSCLAAHLSSYPGLGGCPGHCVFVLRQLLWYDLLTNYDIH